MNHSRAILALFVVAALITGTTGYSTIQAERGVDVETAADGNAYLALEETGTAIENGTAGKAVYITNQFGTDVSVSVDVTASDSGITSQGLNRSDLAAGDTAALEVQCSTDTDQTLTVDVEAESTDISTEIRNQEFTVDCVASGTPSG